MDHDQSYKLLFYQPEMVADLLRGFVHEDWVRHLDFDSLENVGGTYVADDLREREDDVIWKVRWGQDWLYVYLLIEFQSTVDRYMAIRILVYLGLLYQDLVRAGNLATEGRLPPVLRIVLYNGSRRWDAPVNVADLVVPMPGGLETYRPRLKYFLLDEGRYADSELAELRNWRPPCSGWRTVGHRRRWNRCWQPLSPGCRHQNKPRCGKPSPFG